MRILARNRTIALQSSALAAAYGLLTAAFLLVALLPGVRAADIRPYISGSYRSITIEGKIEPGDFDTFIRIIRENNGLVSGVDCLSPGGSFSEATKMGRAMRALELTSQAPMRNASGQPTCNLAGSGQDKPKDPRNCTCASAGFFIHIGAVHRGGTYLAVHRPYFEKGALENLSEADAKAAFDELQNLASDYMSEMGVPRHIQEEVLGTASDQALVLDEKTVKTYFWLQLPYLHERLRSKCAPPAEGNNISKNEKDERNCEIAFLRKSRLDAYVKYFHEQPNDFARHDFAKWNEAARYLGKKFYELTSEERFDEDNRSEDILFLTRPQTATAPYLSLHDSSTKRRVVSGVGVLSAPNPSPEFIQHVLESLETTWGKHTGGNGTTVWLWDTKKFFANLKIEPKSADGSYLRLKLDEKSE